MKKFLLAAAAVAAIATPAAARDGSPYVGIEGGLLMPRDIDGDVNVDFTAGGLADVNADDVFQVDYKMGRDIDVIAGYDFGLFRVEGEAAWKRASFDDIEFDDSVAEDLEDLDFDEGDVDIDGRMKVRSLMVNGLFDIGADDGVSAFVGAGIGRARARLGGQSDKSSAIQFLAGVRAPVGGNVDLGLKYRYFRTGKLDFAAAEAFSGDIDADGDMDAGVLTIGANKRFTSHSLLASLIFNFGAPAVEEAPVIAAPPPPPPAPATQTCPDGSVILATEMCPMAPPPPPPAPAPAGERG